MLDYCEITRGLHNFAFNQESPLKWLGQNFINAPLK